MTAGKVGPDDGAGRMSGGTGLSPDGDADRQDDGASRELRGGLLHTVPALAGTFEAQLIGMLPGVRLVHHAESWLLAEALARGITDEVRDRVRRVCRNLVDDGVEAILVTCSSLGEVAEMVDAELTDAGEAVPVLRIDRPMAEEAVAAAGPGGNVVVLATAASTLGPTTRLVERVARERGVPVTTSAVELPAAAVARAGGDQAMHDRIIADAVAEAGRHVVVLAQASMASAVPAGAALTSPESGMRRFVDVLSRSGR